MRILPDLAPALALWLTGTVILGEDPPPTDLARLREEVLALRPEGSARSPLSWRTCLLDAYRSSREERKPVLVWAFRGDPGEGRC